MSRLTRDGTAEPGSRDQILRHARGQGNINFACSADHEQDWQPYPVDLYSAICDGHTYIRTYILLTQCYHHWGTRLNAMKRLLPLQPMIPPKRFDIFLPLTGGCSEGLDAFRFFFKQCIAGRPGGSVGNLETF